MSDELHLVTAKMLDSDGKAKNHVSSANAAHQSAGMVGGSTYLLPVRNRMECMMVDSNTLRITSGDAMTCGRHWEIKGDYVDVTIENGTPGAKRIDLVAARITAYPQESIEVVVMKGNESASNPVVPGHIEGDLNDGDAVTEVPICYVLIDGINPQTPVNLIRNHLLMPLSELKTYVDNELDSVRDSLSQTIISRGTETERKAIAAGRNTDFAAVVEVPAGYKMAGVLGLSLSHDSCKINGFRLDPATGQVWVSLYSGAAIASVWALIYVAFRKA